MQAIASACRAAAALRLCTARPPEALLQGDALSGWWKIEAVMIETIQQGAWRRGQRGSKNEASGRS